MLLKTLIAVTLTALTLSKGYDINTNPFPEDFIFGTGSSAYQIEGGSNEDGRTESIWDYLSHNRPHLFADESNGDVACDSYHKYEEDIKLLAELGVNFYRFSISWNRVLPQGFSNKINQAGIDYYNKVIDGLLANNITPIITMFHWDMPLSFYNLGGGANPLLVECFDDYARVIFAAFGDRVKFWLTINEPHTVCRYVYTLISPEVWGVGQYLCIHNLLLAHARIYHVYDEVFRPTQKGQISIALDCKWLEPASNSTEDIEAAKRALEFDCGWFGHPIFSKNGDYPEVIKKIVAERSEEEGFSNSRLPTLTMADVQYIKGTADFFGLNHYTTKLVADIPQMSIGVPFEEADLHVVQFTDPSWINSSFYLFKSIPWGFRNLLKWIQDNYNDPVIYIIENGFASTEPQHDQLRIDVLSEYMSYMLDAIYFDNVKVKAYTLWSFLDLFEFFNGYTTPFGLYYVNHSDPNRPRTAKDSAKFYKELIKNRRLK